MDKNTGGVIGIDVSEEWLDLAAHVDGKTRLLKRQPYTKRGLKEILRMVSVEQPKLVVFEATGGVERELANTLHDGGVKFAIVNPFKARQFGLSMGGPAKTDRLDAGMLAQYGSVKNPEPYQMPSLDAQRMSAFRTRRRQVMKIRVAECNRVRRAAQDVQCFLRKSIKSISAEIKQLDREINKLVQADPQLRRRFKILTSFPGVGALTAHAILANLRELGHANPKQLAALVGVAPMPDDSGKRSGNRHITGGRGDVRAELYMGAMAAKRYNPVLRTCYDAMIKAGKPRKVAVIATLRHMLHILNAMLKQDRVWEDRSATAK